MKKARRISCLIRSHYSRPLHNTLISRRPSSSSFSSSVSSKSNDEAAIGVAMEARQDAAWMSKQGAIKLLSTPPPKLLDNKPQTLEAFLQKRGWSKELEGTPGVRILSHLLTYPLTLAHYLEGAGTDHDDEKEAIVMVGARAEATLPTAWWMETIYMYGNSSGKKGGLLNRKELHLHMIGPETPSMSKAEKVVVPTAVAGSRTAEGEQQQQQQQHGGSLPTIWIHRQKGLYHQLLASGGDDNALASTANVNDDNALASTANVNILYNPGIGHPSLANDWKPTLDVLASSFSSSRTSPKRIIWTAHSEKDKDRDLIVLDQLGVKWLVPPKPNPFASRRRLIDPMDHSHILSANEYGGVFTF